MDMNTRCGLGHIPRQREQGILLYPNNHHSYCLSALTNPFWQSLIALLYMGAHKGSNNSVPNLRQVQVPLIQGHRFHSYQTHQIYVVLAQ